MQENSLRRLFPVLAILFLVSAACSLPILPQRETPPAETQAAGTASAIRTRIAGSVTTATPGSAQPTGQPTVTLTPTTVPTTIVFPTATSPVIPTATTRPVCDRAAFISDISIPDGTVMPAGTDFTKTWRLSNTGSCTWTPDYAVVFSGEERMSAPEAQRLGVSVIPGGSVDVAVPMRAPGAPGAYRGYWKLRNAAGQMFGLGPADERFYVDIKVVAAPAPGAGYDFAANACLAQWTGGSKAIPCIGKDGATDGFVLYQSRPILESGYADDEPGLVTNPPLATDSVIRGKYPPFTVRTGDRFKSLLSCEFNAKKCNVRFQLDYQIDNGAIQTLGAWNEAYEGGYSTADVDLSALAGKNVSFILTVLANGASEMDRALWLAPRIENQPTPPTVTPTFTPTPTITVTPTPTVEGYPYP
jgi:hypothetical protein